MRPAQRPRSLALALCLAALGSCLIAAATAQQDAGEPPASAPALTITIPQVPATAAPAAAPAATSSSITDNDGDDSRVSCRVYVVNNTDSRPTFGHVQSSLNVLAAADVVDANVVLQVQHPDVAALEVTLSAASNSKLAKSVTLKAAAFGTAGGEDLVQTIFSDYAPTGFPTEAAAAPYSSVYRPAQPLKLLTAGSDTSAGVGGSKGVWTLAVTDKATKDVNRRPLKLTGWELWLCGETAGPLFAPDSLNATAFDSSSSASSASASSVNVVKKAVVAPKDVDIDVVVKSGLRKAQIEQDPVNAAITALNAYLAKELAKDLDAISTSVAKSNPQLAEFLKGAIDQSAQQLRLLPGVMGYQQNDDGDWVLPDSEAIIRSFLDTLTHCYYDLYWCWENTGLRGNFALDFVNEWNARAGPVAAGWAAAQEQWIGAVSRFEEAFPEANQWSDVLFYSAINTLYDAAAIDAVFSVGETWADTAIRLALWASPVRFAANPRAFITQTLQAVTDILRTVFGALRFVPLLIDDDNNNDVPAITAAAEQLLGAANRIADLALNGLTTRAQGLQGAITQNAGSMARSAAGMNEQLVNRLKGFSPELASIVEAASSPFTEVLKQAAQTEQERVADFFRQQSARRPMRDQLDQSMQLLNDVTLQFTTNAATALLDTANAIDDAIPGPSLRQLLGGLRNETQGILSDARGAIERLLPIPEIQEANALLSATVDSILELLDEAASQVVSSDAAQAVREQLIALSGQLTNVQQGVAAVANGIIARFPGPLFNSTLGIIKRQVDQTANEISSLFDGLASDFPNLNPETFVNQLQALLGELLTGALDQATSFLGLTPPGAAEGGDLVAQLPQLLVDGLTGAIPQLQDILGGLVPDSLLTAAGDGNSTAANALTQVQQGVVSTMNQYVDRVNALSQSIPTTPPAVASIASNLAQRSQALSRSASELLPAINDAAATPSKLAQAGLADLNNGLTQLLDDLKGQQARSGDIARQVAEGPLADVLAGINSTLATVGGGVQGAVDGLLNLLPDLPDLRASLDALLGPAVDALDAALQQASQAGLQALELASQGAVTGLGAVLEGLTQLLINAQWQLAGILGAAVQAGDQLDQVASGGLAGLDPQLLAIETNLATVAGNITQGLVDQLNALTPPAEVIQQLITPLASTLNAQLGAIAGLLNSPNLTSQGLPGALQQLATLPAELMSAAGNALGVPPPPPALPAGGNGSAGPADSIPLVVAGLLQQLLPRPGGPGAAAGNANGSTAAAPPNLALALAGLAEQLLPGGAAAANGSAIQELLAAANITSDANSTSIIQQLGQLLGGAGLQGANLQSLLGQLTGALAGAGNSSAIDSVVSQVAAAYGLTNVTSAADALALLSNGQGGAGAGGVYGQLLGGGRGLLATETTSLQLPFLGSNLLGADGQPFDAAGFIAELGKSLQEGLSQYANTLVASVQGLRGASASEQLRSILSGLGGSVQQAATELRTAAAGLPQGPLLQALLGSDAGSTIKMIEEAMQQLVQGKPSGELIKALSSVSGSLADLAGSGGAGQSGLVPGAGAMLAQLAKQLAGQASPNLNAAQALDSLRARLSNLGSH